jgi:hypothetical protein
MHWSAQATRGAAQLPTTAMSLQPEVRTRASRAWPTTEAKARWRGGTGRAFGMDIVRLLQLAISTTENEV